MLIVRLMMINYFEEMQHYLKLVITLLPALLTTTPRNIMQRQIMGLNFAPNLLSMNEK